MKQETRPVREGIPVLQGREDVNTPTISDEEHGTYGGLQKHKKRGEEPCQPCKDAGAVYMRNYRASRPGRREADRWWNNTRAAALERLLNEYPARFFELLEEERAKTPRPSPGDVPPDTEGEQR